MTDPMRSSEGVFTLADPEHALHFDGEEWTLPLHHVTFHDRDSGETDKISLLRNEWGEQAITRNMSGAQKKELQRFFREADMLNVALLETARTRIIEELGAPENWKEFRYPVTYSMWETDHATSVTFRFFRTLTSAVPEFARDYASAQALQVYARDIVADMCYSHDAAVRIGNVLDAMPRAQDIALQATLLRHNIDEIIRNESLPTQQENLLLMESKHAFD